MALRANWKGSLTLAQLSCPVALYTAASTAERIAFHTLNRKTGHRVHRRFVDSANGKPVEPDNQVKGYETAGGDYVVLEPSEVASALPQSDKIMAIQSFIDCDEVDDIYFDKPYYLAPSDSAIEETYTLLRDGMRQQGVAALAQAVLFRRLRTLLLRPHDRGLIATTLNFDYEVRPSGEIFADIPGMKLKGEMLELAEHIIRTKKGRFDPSQFDDRYESALTELVKAKMEGRKIERPKPPPATKTADLMAALRESARMGAKRRPIRKAG